MPAIGYIQVIAYASNAQIPLKNVSITITDASSAAVAMGFTDKSGKYGPIQITVPDKDESLTPGSSEKPYATVNIHARLENYEQIEADNIQVFAETLTTQAFEMIPLSELPDQWTKTEFFDTPGQNL